MRQLEPRRKVLRAGLSFFSEETAAPLQEVVATLCGLVQSGALDSQHPTGDQSSKVILVLIEFCFCYSEYLDSVSVTSSPPRELRYTQYKSDF